MPVFQMVRETALCSSIAGGPNLGAGLTAPLCAELLAYREALLIGKLELVEVSLVELSTGLLCVCANKLLSVTCLHCVLLFSVFELE